MKIDLASINRDQFYVNENVIAGEKVYLVLPKQIGAEWTSRNLHLRSSVWNSDGELVSASFPKFFNFGEKPSLYPNPESFNDWKVMEKVDGSTLIVSKYKGELIVRTRGTVDASRLELSGHEIEGLKKKYATFFGFVENTAQSSYFSYIFEWVTPANQIVIAYPEPDLVLTAIVSHNDYSLKTQVELDQLAKTLELKRPRSFEFNSLTEMVETVSKFSDMEGVCLYYNNDQNIVKLKGDWYLRIHRLKSKLASLDNVLDYYLEQGRDKSAQEVYDSIAKSTELGFELAEQCKNKLFKIELSLKNISIKLQSVQAFVDTELKSLLVKYGMNGRAHCARAIFAFDKEYAPLYFGALDGKVIDEDRLKKMVLADVEKCEEENLGSLKYD